MSEFTYCDTDDLRFVTPTIDQYDSKRILSSNWVASATSHLFYLYDSGTIDQLFLDGEEMTLVNCSGEVIAPDDEADIKI